MDKATLIKASKYWVNHEKDSVIMEHSVLLSEMEKFILAHNTCSLATGFNKFVRCTPIEYTYKNNTFWLFSEGG